MTVPSAFLHHGPEVGAYVMTHLAASGQTPNQFFTTSGFDRRSGKPRLMAGRVDHSLDPEDLEEVVFSGDFFRILPNIGAYVVAFQPWDNTWTGWGVRDAEEADIVWGEMLKRLDYLSTEDESTPIYEHEEAVAWIVEFTGESREKAELFLESKYRYEGLLRLVADPEEDTEGLARERDIYRRWIPEQPKMMDPILLRGYLVQVLEMDESRIAAMVMGEARYMDSLGLIDWEDETERRNALGDPS